MFTLAMICSLAIVRAEAPAGYYSSLKGKSESALKTELYNIINPHTQVSSYQALPSYFEKTDLYPNSTRWWDMYSDIPLFLPWSGQKLNREHSLPKSWWGGNSYTPAYVDLNHLYPAEAIANQRKSNYPLGEIAPGTTPYYSNGFIKVGVGVNSGGAQYVFEPNDEYKGDFARTYFYMVTCYQNMNWTTEWQVKNGNYPSLQQWAIDLLLKWHRQDRVSQKELDRNEQVYKVQGNRNPFIDDPELAEYIWGNKKGLAYNPSSSEIPGGTPTLITPPNNMALEFNQVALGHSSKAQLQFKSEHCTGYFELYISDPNKFFTISENTVQTSASNTVAGKWITVTYTPSTTGTHNAQLIISEGGLDEGSRIVTLSGECLDPPTLTQLTATNPTDVTNDTYTAHWNEPADETIDYYIVTVKRYKGSSVTTMELPAESNSLTIDGLSQGDYDTYAVQSVRLDVRSPMSNYITVHSTASIEEILIEEPLVIESFPGVIRFRCSNPHEDACVYDIAGRLVMTIATITDGMEINLPQGVYFISTANHRKPVKVLAR